MDIDLQLAPRDQVFLDATVVSLEQFWSSAPYRHYTNHGVEHSARVLKKAMELNALLPTPSRLREEERYVLALSACLYDIGMQNPNLSPTLDFTCQPGEILTWPQLEQIRHARNRLTHRLIQDSVAGGPQRTGLVLLPIAHEIMNVCAEVCLGCSSDPLTSFRAVIPVRGNAARVHLLIALLRLADLLYLDEARVNWTLLARAELPTSQLVSWWVFQYVQTLPLSTHVIPFHYQLPTTRANLFEPLRRYVEARFDYRNNDTIRFLAENGLPLIPSDKPAVTFVPPSAHLRDLPREVAGFLLRRKGPATTSVPHPPPSSKGKRWAVLVGVDQYKDAQHYPQLHVCVNDVNALYEQLVMGGYDPDNVRVLSDDSVDPSCLPTSENIIATLKSVAAATRLDDLLLFYYSGHGDLANDESYLVARTGEKSALQDGAVSIARVKDILKAYAAAGAKVIIVDACHAGADIGGKGATPMSAEFIEHVFSQAQGMAVLASCTKEQVSYEWRDKDRSVFTYHLLDALTGKADRDDKGFVTVKDVHYYVTNGVKTWGGDTVQTPTLQDEVIGDIILALY